MPYKRKDSPTWWASFVDPSGKRVRRSTGTTDRKEAEALEAKWKLEAFQEKSWGKAPSRSFEEVMLLFLRDHEHKRSAHQDKLRCKQLRKRFEGLPMEELSASHIRGYIAARRKTVTAASINRELALLSAAINYANREWECQLPNPVRGRKLREPEGRVRWLSSEEAERLLQEAGKDYRANHLPDFITLALHTGMRRGEMLGLEWSRVDLHGCLIHLGEQHTKAGKRRSVPLNSQARKALLSRARFRAEHCPGSRWVFCHADGRRIKEVKTSFASACKRAGISDFRVHDLRHTCAAWLVTAGVPLTEVRDILGHSTVNMTEKYAHLAPENLRQAVLAIENKVSRFGHVDSLKEGGMLS